MLLIFNKNIHMSTYLSTISEAFDEWWTVYIFIGFIVFVNKIILHEMFWKEIKNRKIFTDYSCLHMEACNCFLYRKQYILSIKIFRFKFIWYLLNNWGILCKELLFVYTACNHVTEKSFPLFESKWRILVLSFVNTSDERRSHNLLWT